MVVLWKSQVIGATVRDVESAYSITDLLLLGPRA